MEMIKRIYKRSAFVLVPVAAFSAFFDWRKLPLSIIAGGIIALANLKGLAWGVEGLLGTEKATAKLVFFSLLRFFILSVILLILILFRLIRISGVMIGLTLVFVLLLKEGLHTAKNES